jgi:hypothetical protein
MLLGWRNELNSRELEAAVLEARDDGTDEATLPRHPLASYTTSIAFNQHTWTPSGLIAMNLSKLLASPPNPPTPHQGRTHVCSVVMLTKCCCSMFWRKCDLSLGPRRAKIGGSAMPEGNWGEDIELSWEFFKGTVSGVVCWPARGLLAA